MRQHEGIRRASDESGAVAVMSAITLTVLILMAALVLDIASLRADRVQSKSAADMAAIAAAVTHDPESSTAAQAACLDAVAFVEANLPSFTAPVGAPDCGVVSSSVCTMETLPATAIYTGGPYTVAVTTPVLDDSPLMESLLHDETHDGTPCERVAVRITRDRDFLLARVAGFDSGETTQSSVARWWPGGDEEIFASLVVLQEEGCSTLKNSGNDLGRLIVGSATVTIDGESVDLPGTITVDTVPEGGCAGNNWQNRIIAVQGNNQALVRADGRIFAHGLQSFEQPRIYWSDIVKTDPATTDGLYPRPTAGPTITRQAVDHRFNCLSNYPTDQAWSPAWTSSQGVAISDCNIAEGPLPYLSNLVTALGGLTATRALDDTDWSVFPDDVVGATCDGAAASGTVGPGTANPASRWFIDCPAGNGQAFSPTGLTFRNVEYVVSENQIRLGGGEGNFLAIEGDAADGAVLYVKNGRIDRTGQARLYLIDTFVYLDNGPIEFGGNNPNDAALNHPGCSPGSDPYGVCWHAPTVTMNGCDGYTGGLPPAACFQPLALWSNTTTAHDLGGQASFDISGSFFTPNALPFGLSGQSAQDFTRAQFFTAQLEMSGQAPVLMAPNPDTNIPIPLPGILLIR